MAIVAAMQREVAPLVKGWSRVARAHGGRTFQCFEADGAALVCGGIGPLPARRAAEALVELYRPKWLVSTGYAGALSPQHRLGDVLFASAVVDALDGCSFAAGGRGVLLVSAPGIAGKQEKAALRARFGAELVDLEAAAIAQVAHEHRLRFAAVKVVSDESDAALPPFARFIEDGRFDEGRFLRHAALRPWLWPTVIKLGLDSARASLRLSAALGDLLQRGLAPGSDALGRHAGHR